MRTRKEQVAELTGVYEDAGLSGKDAKDAAEKDVAEAEERARAECAADTRRLEWLEKTRSVVLEDADNGWRVTIGGIEFSLREETARNAIDAAMETK